MIPTKVVRHLVVGKHNNQAPQATNPPIECPIMLNSNHAVTTSVILLLHCQQPSLLIN